MTKRTNQTTWLERPLCALALVLLQPVIFYRKALINPTAHIPYDIEGFHLPLAAYIARSARQGVLPLWDPFPYCGMPIHADLQAQLFYPPAWIAMLLGNLSQGHKLFYWVEWLVPLHMMLAGIFTFLLLRRLGCRTAAALLGASVYQLGGYYASQAEHLGAISCGAWLPLCVLAVVELGDRAGWRWIAILGIALALSVLSGFAATALVTITASALVLTGLLITRRASWHLVPAYAASVVLSAAITAVQIGPTYKLTQLSIASIRSEYHVSGGGLKLQSLISLVIPNFYNIFRPFDKSLYKLPYDFTQLYIYCGLIPLALVVIVPFLHKTSYARLFWGLTIVSALWMLGDNTVVYRTIYPLIPHLVRGALYSEYALMAFSLFFGLTAALSFHSISGRWKPFLVGALVLISSADLMRVGSQRPMNSGDGGYKQTGNSEYAVSGRSEPVDILHRLTQRAEPPVRVDYVDGDFVAGQLGANMLAVPTPDGNNPFVLQRLLYVRRLFCRGMYWQRNLPVDKLDSPLVDFLNIGYLVGIRELPERWDQKHFELATNTDVLKVLRNLQVLPRFFLVSKVHRSANLQAALAYLGSAQFRPKEEAVVEDFAVNWESGPLRDATVSVENYSPNRVELETRADHGAFLVSSEAFYPGWNATIDGKRTTLVMTNGAFRGLPLEPGVHRIVMVYWPEHFAMWLSMSAAGVITAIFGILRGGTRVTATLPA